MIPISDFLWMASIGVAILLFVALLSARERRALRRSANAQAARTECVDAETLVSLIGEETRGFRRRATVTVQVADELRRDPQSLLPFLATRTGMMVAIGEGADGRISVVCVPLPRGSGEV